MTVEAQPTAETPPAAPVATPDGAPTATPDGAPRRPRKRLLIGAGALCAVALGGALALVSLPAGPETEAPTERRTLTLAISPERGFQLNLAGLGGDRYLAMTVTAEVEALDEARAAERAGEELWQARLQDAVIRAASRVTLRQLEDAAGKEAFRESLRAALDVVLFPVLVGEVADAHGTGARRVHAASGLAAGRSMERATMRGPFHEHALTVDAPGKTIRLDDGVPLGFAGHETDLEVRDEDGRRVWVDVTRLVPEFRGEVPIGVLGVVRRVYFPSFLVQ